MIRPEDKYRLEELLRQFTYRPGWSFSVVDNTLVVRATVIDTDNPTQECPLSYGTHLPFPTPPGFEWDQWLFRKIMEIEEHEAREFFKVGGIKVFDPHG